MSEGAALGALSVLDWWREAGVDTLADDMPRDWLAKAMPLPRAKDAASPLPFRGGIGGGESPATRAPSSGGPALAPEGEGPQDLPADLPAFRRWLLEDPSLPFAPRLRHDAAGDPARGCMVVVDMPEAADRGAGALLTGEAGARFDRMLAAIGLDRDALYLAPFSPARPATGRLDKPAATLLERLMRHHIALAAPARLLLLGEAAVCALTGVPVHEARGRVHRVEAGARAIPAVASFAPRLVEGPDFRRRAWADLQAFKALA